MRFKRLDVLRRYAGKRVNIYIAEYLKCRSSKLSDLLGIGCIHESAPITVPFMD